MRDLLAVLALSLVTVQTAPPAAPANAFFESNGVSIRYVEQGDGAPVVLMHGYTGTLDRHWINNGVFADLAKNHRVIAFDARGHGKSGKPHDPTAYGPEMGLDVIRLLDHLRIPRAHIVGFSMGALVAGQLVTTHPDRFITATLVAHHPIHRWTAADQREMEASATELAGPIPFKSLVVFLTPPGTPVPDDEEIRKRVEPLIAANDVKALEAYHRGRPRLVVTREAVAAIRVPTLAIVGTADPAVEGVRELGKINPSIKIVIIEGAEHGGERGILRHRDFLPTLRAFLAAAQPRASRHLNGRVATSTNPT
jgi:pimeloyl-ACP methyl ester carboxylesterase